MKKLIVIYLALILSVNFLEPKAEAEIPVEDFTHAVFAEEFTATWCVYCPSAAENLMKVYDEIPNEPYYHDKFFFVALITDVNDKADERMGDYPDVTGYPTVVFDGNDEKVSGGQSDTSNYESAIDNVGQREDTDISLDVEMNHHGGDELELFVEMTWNEDASLGNPTFNGFIRAYIVEKESRYNNYDGDPYHFGFLDYAIETSVELEPHEKKMLYATWKGGEHEDSNGNDFSDIDYDNINIFVAFFNDESSTADKYVLETAFAIPPEFNVDVPEGLVGGDLEISGHAISKKSEIKKVHYRWDQGGWLDSGINTFNGDFTLDLDTRDLTNGGHELHIKVSDKGASKVQSMTIEVLNDDNPPSLQIISPQDGDTLENITIFEVEAIDDNQISKVEYKVNEGDWRKMYSSEGDLYIASWNTQEAGAGNGNHQIEFRAIDMSDNVITENIEISVLNQEDISYPYLRVNNPEEQIYNGRIEINVEASDPEGIEKVQFRVDNGTTWKDLELESNEIYVGMWTPTWDGWHWIDFMAVDNQGYQTFSNVRIETDSNPPVLSLDSFANDISAMAEFGLNVYDYSNLISLKYRINGGEWNELDQSQENVEFSWDSTKYEDGECLMEIECIDRWGSVSTLYRNLDVKNQGLIFTVPPSNVVTEDVITLTSIVDYEQPKAVSLIIAKMTEGILAEGQKIPMEKEGNYYTGEIFFENSGVYVYSIEVDTGHGKLKSIEQTLIVSEKQTIAAEEEPQSILPNIGLLPVISILLLIASRRRKL